MKPVLDSWNINVVGLWNVAILSPQWLGEHIFSPKSDISVEVSLLPNQPARFTCDGVRIIPSANRLVIAPVDFTDKVLKRCEDVVCKILELLRHTPTLAVGINFGFLEEDIDADLLSHFEDRDSTIFSDAGFRIGQRTLTRQVFYEDQLINLSIALNNQEVKFDFNFHTSCDNTDQAILGIRDKVLANRNTAQKILNDIYNVNPEE